MEGGLKNRKADEMPEHKSNSPLTISFSEYERHVEEARLLLEDSADRHMNHYFWELSEALHRMLERGDFVTSDRIILSRCSTAVRVIAEYKEDGDLVVLSGNLLSYSNGMFHVEPRDPRS